MQPGGQDEAPQQVMQAAAYLCQGACTAHRHCFGPFLAREIRGCRPASPRENAAPRQQYHSPGRRLVPSLSHAAAFQAVHRWVDHLLETKKVTTITTTGHSLGAALSTLCAFDIAEYLEALWTQVATHRAGWKTVGGRPA